MSVSKDLYSQTQVLRQRLDEFVTAARHNEQKLRRFQHLELRLIALDSLAELLETLLYPDYGTFHWDTVTLLLFDPEYEIQRTLEEEGFHTQEHPALLFANTWEDISSTQPYSIFPMLGLYRTARHAALFPVGPAPTSIAILPLVRYGKLIGSLNIGSHSTERFVRGVRTDILERFAAVVAICLENAVNLSRLKRQGLTDTLTAINNRRFFDQRLQEEVAQAYRLVQPLACLVLDVDHFKRVNDTHGHVVGDQVLREIAAIIRAQLRGSDVLSRYGGEEFAALMARTDVQEAVEVAERVRRSVAEHVFCVAPDITFNVTISIGAVALAPGLNTSPARLAGEILLSHADRALYEAKGAGRNCVMSAGEITLEMIMEAPQTALNNPSG